MFLGSLLSYHSYASRPVLGRWSYPFLAVVLGAAGVWLAALVATARAGWRRAGRPVREPAAAALLDLALLTWGMAYLVGTVDAPATAARILDVDLFGSVSPLAALLEWVALAALAAAAGSLVLHRLAPEWANPALSLAALVVLTVAGEGVARVKVVAVPATAGFPTYSDALWYRRHVQLNREGFRDREHAALPEPGTRRCLVVGDSYAFGVGIDRIDDRFGEQLGTRLEAVTGARWEVINASRPDIHSLHEIALLQRMLPLRPDVVVLVYVFNDIDYLRPVTERTVVTEAPRTLLQRLHPVRVLFTNSYLFQELYMRVRLLAWRRAAQAGRIGDAYADSAALTAHIGDLARFVSLARGAGAVVGIVPFDHAATLVPAFRSRDERFVSRARTAGLPVWPVDGAFAGLAFSQLTVNGLDGHPNELADRLAAEAVVGPLVAALERR